MTQLATNRIKQAEFTRVLWEVTPEVGTPFEALLDPKYWAHVSAQFRRGARIEVLPPDNSYFAELLVIDAGKLFAKVKALRFVNLSEPVQPEQAVEEKSVAAGYEIKWAGRAKWRVIRSEDRATLSDGHEERQKAADWLDGHLKQLAA